jgi:hypothetical protein
MSKVAIYDFNEFKTTYPTLESEFSKLLKLEVFEFLQCESMDGIDFEIVYQHPYDEDVTAGMEINLETLEVYNFEICRD